MTTADQVHSISKLVIDGLDEYRVKMPGPKLFKIARKFLALINSVAADIATATQNDAGFLILNSK
jgi:hypothetical protein